MINLAQLLERQNRRRKGIRPLADRDSLRPSKRGKNGGRGKGIMEAKRHAKALGELRQAITRPACHRKNGSTEFHAEEGWKEKEEAERIYEWMKRGWFGSVEEAARSIEMTEAQRDWLVAADLQYAGLMRSEYRKRQRCLNIFLKLANGPVGMIQ